jgi:hypothetical protein
MAHGYYDTKGNFIETATKAEATDAWRRERGYSTGGVYAMPGGEVIDTRSVARERETTPAATLAQTFTDTPTVPYQELANTLAARYPTTAPVAPTYTHEDFRLGQVDRTTTVPEQQYSVFGEPIDLQGPIGLSFADVPSRSRAVQPTTTTIPEDSTVGRWIGRGEEEPTIQPSQYTGRQYYMGGSEQAYLGPVKQAEEYFFGTGDRWGLGSSYIDIAPEDRKPPPILNQSTVRILTKSGPSYLEGVDYGPSMTMQDIERIYEYDPVTGHYLLKGATEPTVDYGYGYYTSSGQGYASAGPGYGQGYGYGSRGGQIGGNLVHWRIGF